MKHAIRVAAVLCLIAFLMPVSAERRQSMERSLMLDEETGYVSAMASLDDTLYLLMDTGLFALSPGEDAPRLLSEEINAAWREDAPPVIEYMFSGGGRLYGLSAEADELHEIRVDERGARMDKLIEIPGFQDKPLRDSLCADGEALYALFEGSIHRADMSTGDVASTPAQDITHFCLYQPGRYLAIRQRSGQERELVRIDADTGNAEAICPISSAPYFSGMAYDEDLKTLVIADRSSFYTWREGEKALRYAAGFGQGDSYGLSLLTGGYAAILIDTPMLAVRGILPNMTASKPRLTLADPLGRSEDYRAFFEQYPEIDLAFLPGSQESPEEMFIRHMLTKDSSVDVYLLSDQNLMGAIRDKGYAADMAESRMLKALSERLYPAYASAFMRDGKLLALPKQAFLPVICYHEEGFRALQLTPPKTYAQFADFYLQWMADWPEGHPDYSLRLDYLMDHLTPETVLKNHADWLSRHGKEIRFDTPELKALMEGLLKMWQAHRAIDPQEGTPLFTLRDAPAQAGYRYLPLSFDEELPAAVTFPPDAFSLKWFVVNPFSHRKQEALHLVESFWQGLRPNARMILDSGMTEAIQNPEYEREAQRRREEIALNTDKLKGLEDAERREAEQTLEAMREALRGFEAENRWWVSQEDVNRYRALTPLIYLNPFNPVLELLNSQPQFFLRLSEPGADAGRFLKELDDMCRLMLLERK